MASNLCVEPGCDQPRYKGNPRCKTHQQARWRAVSKQNRRKQGAEQARSVYSRGSLEKCPLCHRTPLQASLAAARGITCTGCNVAPADSRLSHLQAEVKRLREQHPPVTAPFRPANTPPVVKYGHNPGVD